MAKHITMLKLDFAGNKNCQQISAKQGDRISREIHIYPCSGNEAIILNDTDTVDIRCIKPDKTTVVAPANINSDGTVTVTLNEQVLTVAGEVLADIAILGKNGEVLSSSQFKIIVNPSAANKDYLPSSDYYKRENDIDMNGHTLKNLSEPSDDADAANKQYVDNTVKNIPKPDWLQNNPQGAGFIKNRPFWYEYKPPVVEEATVTFNAEDADIAEREEFIIFLNERINLIGGKEYEVSYTLLNGVQKTVKVVAVDAYYEAPEIAGECNTLIVLTAESDPGAPPEEEFGFVIYDGAKLRLEDGGLYIGNYTTVVCYKIQSFSITVSKSIDKSVYHQIDPKFVPNLPYEEVKQEEEILTFKFSDSTVEDFTNGGHFIALDAPIGLVDGKMYKSVETDNATSTQTTYNFPAIEAEPETLPGVIFYGFDPDSQTSSKTAIYDHCDIDMTAGDLVPGDKAFILFNGDYNLDFYLSEEESTVHKLDERFYDQGDWKSGYNEAGYIKNKPFGLEIFTGTKKLSTDTSVIPDFLGLIPGNTYTLTINDPESSESFTAQGTAISDILSPQIPIPFYGVMFRKDGKDFLSIAEFVTYELIQASGGPVEDLGTLGRLYGVSFPTLQEGAEISEQATVEVTGTFKEFRRMIYSLSAIPELQMLELFDQEIAKIKEQATKADLAAFQCMSDVRNYFYGRIAPELKGNWNSGFGYGERYRVVATKIDDCFSNMKNENTLENCHLDLENIKSIPDDVSSYNKSAFRSAKYKNVNLYFHNDIELGNEVFSYSKIETLSLNFSNSSPKILIEGSRHPFEYMFDLKDIFFNGAKIYGKYCYFYESENLTADAVGNIVNALADYSTEENPDKHYLRLHYNARALLTDSQKTQITAKGWTL